MLKKLFNILSAFTFLSVAFFVIVLFYNKPRALPFMNTPYHLVNGSNTLSWMIKQRIPQLWPLDTDAPKESPVALKTTPAANQTLEPCPDTPPDLVGPLHVDFKLKRSLDELRQEFKSSLQKGGRYKPPECISQQKVGEGVWGVFILFILIQSHENLIIF